MRLDQLLLLGDRRSGLDQLGGQIRLAPVGSVEVEQHGGKLQLGVERGLLGVVDLAVQGQDALGVGGHGVTTIGAANQPASSGMSTAAAA